MAPVVCDIRPSVHAARRKSAEEIGASITAVYDKLTRIETEVFEALVRETAARLTSTIDEMPGGRRSSLLRGYRTKILDGNCLGASEQGILELRSIASGPLPGKSLVVLDPERMLAIDVFACGDGHAQERSLLRRVVETVEKKDLWIADRNFCTAGFLRAIDRRGGCFVIRHHRGLVYETCGPWKELGKSETGHVMERTVKFVDDEGQWFVWRLVRVYLREETRDGDDELLLLTNLPEPKADARMVAQLYRHRWLLETAFFAPDGNVAL